MTILERLERGAPWAYMCTAVFASIAVGASTGQAGTPKATFDLVPVALEAGPQAPTVVARASEPDPAPTPQPVSSPQPAPKPGPSPKHEAKLAPTAPVAPRVAKARPSPPVAAPPGPEIDRAPDPILEVVRGLDQRGLLLSDLDGLPNVKLELDRLEAGRSQGPEELWSALAEADLPNPLLRRKLDGLRQLLARPGLDPEVASQGEKSYLQLETELASSPNVAQKHRLAADIRRLRVRLIR